MTYIKPVNIVVPNHIVVNVRDLKEIKDYIEGANKKQAEFEKSAKEPKDYYLWGQGVAKAERAEMIVKRLLGE